jgi:hypothetical protein
VADTGGNVVAVLRAKLAAQTISVEEAVWVYLESRRGESFCSVCLAGALDTTRRIDRALMGVEGRGAWRHYAPCSMCGKDRLLTGLRGPADSN